MTSWSRRDFLTRIGQIGGSAAMIESMVALGLVGDVGEWHGRPKVSPNMGRGKTVLILGAGIGGLATAYNLTQAGFRCEILEASGRVGGRNHTARRGSLLTERLDGEQVEQYCDFDEGQYVNLGPGRLPFHHRRILGYCKELQVALEPYIMNASGNLFQSDDSFGGRAKPYRVLQHDSRGLIAELLAKAVNQGALNQDLQLEDRARMISLLRRFGPLGGFCDSGDLIYRGSTRTGCSNSPNVFNDCDAPVPLSRQELLRSEFWTANFYDPLEFEWQPTLFQPVGGMDMIVEGFMRHVGHMVTCNAPVTHIEVSEWGVYVTYQFGSARLSKFADYCVSNIPCPILRRIPHNFERSFSDAVRRTGFSAACKVGWQCESRFWESDPYQIYGGISWTDDLIEQIWYPSHDPFTQKGTLTGAYIHDGFCSGDEQNASLFGSWNLNQRLQVARTGAAKLHPEFLDERLVKQALGLSVAWQNVPFLEGAWPNWGGQQFDDADYRRLLLPDRRFYVVGDQASTLPGWQEGAVMSAEHVVGLITGLTSHYVPDHVTAPDTLKVTRSQG
ncbi:MAG: FAD-dependent oxidoreductase [Acidobacteria bacterium]|nr:FAD-dependent oxidoreductase [Acidobacteriota bacterium]